MNSIVPRYPEWSGQPQVGDERGWIDGQCLEQVPLLIASGGDERADGGEVFGTLLGPEPARDFLPQFHHPPVALCEIIGEWHRRVGQEAKNVRPSRAESQQQVVANPSWRPAARPGLWQGGLALLEGQAIGHEGVGAPPDQGGPRRVS